MATGKLGMGVDVGSTTTKAVLIDHTGSVLATHIMTTGATAEAAAAKCIEEICNKAKISPENANTIGTGYGRALVGGAYRKITEITCHSVGVYHLNPEIRFLIDVGGQDSKVIKIGPKGRPEDFEINDKCSAGTGRFLEVMARVLDVSMDELGPLALESNSPSTISSTCTVFAESEVIGRIGAGDSPRDIAAGIHASMAAKIATLSKRVGVVEPVGVTGGVALNPAFRHYISKKMNVELWIPKTPQLTGALGAAVLALKE